MNAMQSLRARRVCACWLAALVLALAPSLAHARPTAAFQGDDFEKVSLRVTSAKWGGFAEVDRGARDGLEIGDSVLLVPRGADVMTGMVADVRERSATVRLANPDWVPEPGTRGEALIPNSRFADEDDAPAPPDPIGPPIHGDTAPDEPEGTDGREGWTSSMPLLSRVRPVRPSERSADWSGRITVFADQTLTAEGGRAHRFFRTGVDSRYRNPFGNGGELRVDAEFVKRDTDVPGNGDESTSSLRVDRASYTIGGTRFDSERVEGGRFLQHVMPEFGRLDGVEWTRRRKNGDRFGASFGYMPEPDADLDTGDDLQLAGYYEWVSDDREQWTVAGGIQKTMHNGAQDRDLIVTRARYFPLDGWSFHGAAWIDYYDSGDHRKDTGFELTQAQLSTGRRFGRPNAPGSGGIDFSLRRLRFPETDRNEIPPVTQAQLSRDRYDRLSAGGWVITDSETRVHSQVGLWADEDDQGGDVEIGVGMSDLLADDSLSDITLFSTRGQFSLVVGGRVSIDRTTQDGTWRLFYEVANHHRDGFSSAIDDLIQHRLRASRDGLLRSGWSYSVYAEVLPWDEEGALSVGGYFQKSF